MQTKPNHPTTILPTYSPSFLHFNQQNLKSFVKTHMMLVTKKRVQRKLKNNKWVFTILSVFIVFHSSVCFHFFLLLKLEGKEISVTDSQRRQRREDAGAGRGGASWWKDKPRRRGKRAWLVGIENSRNSDSWNQRRLLLMQE
jgi:hypothetical protein